MATFKVGQRVRIINGTPLSLCGPNAQSVVGREATILGPLKQYRNAHTQDLYSGHLIAIDGIGPAAPSGLPYAAPPEWLAPLTDPKAEAFLALIRQLKPLNVSEVA